MKRRTILGYIIVFCLTLAIFFVLQLILQRVFDNERIADLSAFVLTLLLFNPLQNQVLKRLEKVMDKKQLFTRSQILQLKEEVAYITHLLRLQRVLIRRIAEVLRIQIASLYLLDESSNIYDVCDGIGINPKDKRKVQFKTSGGLLVWLRMERKALYFPELTKDQRYEYLGKEEKEKIKKLQAELCIPLVLGTQIVGMLFLGKKSGKESYTPDEIALLQDVANQAAQALVNATAQRDLTNRERELNRYQLRIKNLEDRLQEVQQNHQSLLDYLKTGLLVLKVGNKTVELNESFRETLLPDLNNRFKDFLSKKLENAPEAQNPENNA